MRWTEHILTRHRAELWFRRRICRESFGRCVSRSCSGELVSVYECIFLAFMIIRESLLGMELGLPALSRLLATYFWFHGSRGFALISPKRINFSFSRTRNGTQPIPETGHISDIYLSHGLLASIISITLYQWSYPSTNLGIFPDHWDLISFPATQPKSG